MASDYPRWSSQTIDTRKPVALSRLLKSWEKVPSMRLGELFVRAVREGALDVGMTMSRMEDDELLEAIERFILLASSGDGETP